MQSWDLRSSFSACVWGAALPGGPLWRGREESVGTLGLWWGRGRTAAARSSCCGSCSPPCLGGVLSPHLPALLLKVRCFLLLVVTLTSLPSINSSKSVFEYFNFSSIVLPVPLPPFSNHFLLSPHSCVKQDFTSSLGTLGAQVLVCAATLQN